MRNCKCKVFLLLVVFTILALPVMSNAYECHGSWCSYDDPIGWIADCQTFQETEVYPTPTGAVNPLIEEVIETLNVPNCDTRPSKSVVGPTVHEKRDESLEHEAALTLQTSGSWKTGGELDFALADSVGAKADSEVSLSNGTSTLSSWKWTTSNGIEVVHNAQTYTVAYGKRIKVTYTAKSRDGHFSGAGRVDWSVCENSAIPPFNSRTTTGKCEKVESDASAGRAYVPGSYKEYAPVWSNENCPGE
jgi:microcompartment protein CcmK/EutM